MKDIILAPSILAADFTRLGEDIRAAEDAGAGWFHIDVMDGHFVPNLTMGPFIIEAVRRITECPLDVHLMVTNPERLLSAYADAGATNILVHYEVCEDLFRTISRIRALGCKAGVALNPHTPALVLSEILPLLDEVLVMTVSPGFGGQALIPQTLTKITQVANMAHGYGQPSLRISVDGGINASTAREVAAAGADVLVVGSAVFNSTFSVAEGFRQLNDALGA